ncbi:MULTISPECIES: hypothetical protein [Bradyrhizobium]|jgi:hypothetical protein|uniref:hypothetical protein n=1 Tax=Bradyrhizobium TaxID=374 RepID=UPI0012AB5E52|nr:MULTISPECIES: hypothetical protein [Bradyrhizobium]
MAVIASVFSRATPERRSEEGTVAFLALFGVVGLAVSLWVFSRGVELSAEFF